MRQDIFDRKLKALQKRYTKQIAKLHDATELRIERIEDILYEYQNGIMEVCKKAY